MIPKHLKALSLSAIITLASMPATAQTTLWKSYEEAGAKAYAAGKYAEAERLFTEALQAAKQIDGNEKQLSRTYNDLGTTYRELGKYAQSEEVLTKAISLIEKSDNEDSGLMAFALNNLANVYLTQAKFAEAEQLYAKVLELGEKKALKSGNSSTLVLPLNNMSNAYINDGKYSQAQELLKRVVAIYNDPKISKDGYYIGTYCNLALLSQAQGDYKMAEQHYTTALQECEKLLTKNHPRYAVCLIGLSDCYIKEGRYKDAENALQECKELLERTNGSGNPELSNVLGELALAYESEGNYLKAEPLAKTALELRERAFGRNHTLVAESLITQGQIFQQQGRYPEAEAAFKKAIEIRENILGSTHPKLALGLTELAGLYLDSDRITEAESLLQRALEIDKKKFTFENAEIADIQRLLASAYTSQGKYDEAETLYKHSMQATENALGKTHPHYAATLRDLAKLYQKQGKYNQAEELFKHSLTIDEQQFGANSPKVGSDLDLLAKLYVVQKDPEKAAELSKRSERIKNALPGSAQLNTLKEAENDNAQKLKQASKPVSDKWALLVGISNFADPAINLKYAAKDATDFRNFLVSKEQFQADHVRLLTDKSATSQNIKDQLGDKWLGRLAAPDDLVIIYLSTHGSDTLDVGEEKVNFLVAHDTDKNKLVSTGIPMKYLTNIIKEQVHSDRVVLIMDVCHSGAAAPGEKGLGRSSAALATANSPKGVDAQKIPLGVGQTVLCSSLCDQVSWESKNYQNSVFTKQLMEALQANGNQTTLTDAYAHLKDTVESEVLRDRAQLQTPILNTRLWTGGDAVIAIKAAKPRKAL